MHQNQLAFPMVLVDTEYTAFGHSLKTAWWKPWQHKEIVQIAAIKLDKDRNEIDSLNIIVKPALNPKLSNRFIKLTGIQQNDVDTKGISFAEALPRFVEFTKNVNVCTYNTDFWVFEENCQLNNIDFPFKETPFARVSEHLVEWGIDREKYSSGTLYKAVGETMNGHVHNALHDVRSMAVALIKLIK